MNPDRYSEFSSYIANEVNEKLHFLQMAAKNSDMTEVEYIVDSLARFFRRFEFNNCYANTKQLEVSLSSQESSLHENVTNYITTINENMGVHIDEVI